MLTYTSDQWLIIALIFILGLLIGAFMTAGGRRKWKTRYRDEVAHRERIEAEHKRHHKEWEAREKEWRDQDSRRSAAIKDSDRDHGRDVRDRDALDRDRDRDGVRDERDRRPDDDRRA